MPGQNYNTLQKDRSELEEITKTSGQSYKKRPKPQVKTKLYRLIDPIFRLISLF